MEKLWKRVYRVATLFNKQHSPYYLIREFHKIFDYLDKLKLEGEKIIDLIRRNLSRTRPTMLNRQLLEDYIKRLELANDIVLNLDILLTRTFSTFFEFINIYWTISENIDTSEQQKILAEKYDMSLTEWQMIVNKIERFNDIIKACI